MENQNHRLNSNQTTNPVQDSNTINQNDLNLSQSESNPDLNNTNFQEAKQQDEKNQANGHANKQNNNKFDITDLKKNPELYQKILNEAIQLENDNIKPKSYLFSFRIHYKTHFGDKLVIVGSEEFLGN